MQINIKPQNGDDALAEKSKSKRANEKEREKKREIYPSQTAPSMSNAEEGERERYKSRIVSNI